MQKEVEGFKMAVVKDTLVYKCTSCKREYVLDYLDDPPKQCDCKGKTTSV